MNPSLNARVQRRHHVLRRTGVTVVERQLRCRWEWGFRQSDLPDPRGREGTTQTVQVAPCRRAREKGIDVALALDVVDLAQNGHMDVAVIFSSNTDLCEVARVVHGVTRRTGRVSVEAAVWASSRAPHLLEHYDYTHNLRREVFDQTSDSFDYDGELPPGKVHAFVDTCRSSARAGCV